MANVKYEIKYTSDWDEAEELALEGWEIVSVSPMMFVYGIGITYYYFRRPIQ